MSELPTPIQARLAIRDDPASAKLQIRNTEIYNLLLEDVREVERYRAQCEPYGTDSFRRWFSDAADEVFHWIDPTRDFIYTQYGLHALINRYLYHNEPIQYAMLRIARLFAPQSGHRDDDDMVLWRVMYDVLSCGMIHVSSILAAADSSIDAIVPGEACRLLCATDTYDHRLVRQTEHISSLISLGVGVGFGAENIPKFGASERGKIRSGFRSFAKKLNACNHMTLHERKPKIALYIYVHNDTLFEALDIKVPAKAPLENIFIGLMIPDYFMECVREDGDWYFFSGTTRDEHGKTLGDYTGEEYARRHREWVAAGLYTERHRARDVMNAVLQSIVISGSPYVIWSDNVNRYNNQRHRGVIKTLNLCAEITNYSDSTESSSCTLLSCNMAMFRDHEQVIDSLYDFLKRRYGVRYECLDFEHDELARYAYALGYIGTVALNRFMGPERRRREIGLNPLGVYDMALIANVEPQVVSRTVCEAMYKGAVQSSCDEARERGTICVNYPGSEFSFGRPQFVLRDMEPESDWSNVRKLMRQGMANSMLTSQAPTATTCLLTGVTESVTIPMASLIAKESENGRDKCVVYGLMYRSMNSAHLARVSNGIDEQLAMYTASLPYVDHSQSTMFSLPLDTQAIFNLLVRTYRARLKTAIYYVLFKQRHPTLETIKRTDEYDEEDGGDAAVVACSIDCDSCTM